MMSYMFIGTQGI